MFSIYVRRVIMVHSSLDFRKQWNGLLVEARRAGFEPYDGDLVVFVRRDKTQLRAISGDEKGLYLFSRRFEGGSLRFEFDGSRQSITQAELAMWFEGAHFTVHRRVRNWKKQLP